MEFVDYNIAVSLKEKGFDEPCIAGFQGGIPTLFSDIPHNLEGNIHKNSEGSFTCAPLYQQVINWLDKKEIFCSAELDISDGTFKWYPTVKLVVDFKLKETRLSPKSDRMEAIIDIIQKVIKSDEN